jgi:hypothetical protein
MQNDQSFAAAKAIYSEACRAYLEREPDAQAKVEQALERLRSAEAPIPPAGEGFRAGARPLFVVPRR